MKKRIVITGSNGLLGQHLVSLFASKNSFEVFGFSRGENRITKTKNFRYTDLDITSSNDLVSYLDGIKPHYIINAAAMTNVDACEDNKEECDAINVDAVKVLIACCEKYNAHVIHISTDFIFDGEKGYYKEDDKPNPLNYYGLSKWKSEELLQNSNINYTVLRTILVYGVVENANRGNIVLWVKGMLEKKQEISVINDQFRMPILADDLAMACWLVVQKNEEKVMEEQVKECYHISSSELLSIHEIAGLVAKTFELDSTLIKTITTEELGQKAIRPKKTGFVLDKAERELGFQAASFKDRLTYFKETYF